MGKSQDVQVSSTSDHKGRLSVPPPPPPPAQQVQVTPESLNISGSQNVKPPRTNRPSKDSSELAPCQAPRRASASTTLINEDTTGGRQHQSCQSGGNGWYGNWMAKSPPLVAAKVENVVGTWSSAGSRKRAKLKQQSGAITHNRQDTLGAPSLSPTSNSAIISNPHPNNPSTSLGGDSICPSEPEQQPSDSTSQADHDDERLDGQTANSSSSPIPSSTKRLSAWWSGSNGIDEPREPSVGTCRSATETTLLDSSTAPRQASGDQNKHSIVSRDVPPSDVESQPPNQSGYSWFMRWSRMRSPQSPAPDVAQADTRPSESTEKTSLDDASKDPPKSTVKMTLDDAECQSTAQPLQGYSSWIPWSRQSIAIPAPSEELDVVETSLSNKADIYQPDSSSDSGTNQLHNPKTKKTTNTQKAKAIGQIATDALSLSSNKTMASNDVADPVVKPLNGKVTAPDLVLPAFKNTYSLAQQPSTWQNIKQYFLGGEKNVVHMEIVGSMPRLNKAVAIGIHGFFPAAIFQRVLGAPTGTSIKFAGMAAAAIKRWTSTHGSKCEIETIALEGEGLISDRVEILWKLLLEQMNHVKSADLVLFACHSQGVPVTIMLVDKLIKFGLLPVSVKIGICAMAGINLGPFIGYKTQLLGRSALELFDFSQPSSKVSVEHMAALHSVLKYGVKLTYVGSLDDQLVSLESLSMDDHLSQTCKLIPLNRMSLRIHADYSSLTELVAFALKLRNFGLSDHGLIRELSPALAGSLYTGAGHSRLYECVNVYDLAVSFTLETTPCPDTSLVAGTYEGPLGNKDRNPFFLPWAMRGILEEDKVRKELGGECQHLLYLFDKWQPISKGLKDIRFRLAALKSRM